MINFEIPSPCNQKCGLLNNICTGCSRTIQEIIDWRKLPNADKQKIIDRIQQNSLSS